VPSVRTSSCSHICSSYGTKESVPACPSKSKISSSTPP
jgi:hypothetical protein